MDMRQSRNVRSRRRLVYTTVSSPVTGISRLTLHSPSHVTPSHDSPRPLTDNHNLSDNEVLHDTDFDSTEEVTPNSRRGGCIHSDTSLSNVKRSLFTKKRSHDDVKGYPSTKKSRLGNSDAQVTYDVNLYIPGAIVMDVD